jgi:hypothetical protein
VNEPPTNRTAERRGARPLLLTVLGPPLRLAPLLELRRESVLLAFTDDPTECSFADAVLLSNPPVGDVREIRGHAEDVILVVIVPHSANPRRVARLRAAGADVCLHDPDVAELGAALRRLVDSGWSARPREGRG